MSQSLTLLQRQGLPKPIPQLGLTPTRRLDPLGVLLVILSTLGFSTLAIFGKLAYAHELDPLSALFWRLAGATVLLWTWLLIRGQWRIPYRSAIAAFLLGDLGYALQAVLFFSALSHSSAGLTAVMFYTYPAFVALLSWVINRRPLGCWRLIALGLALAGCIMTIDMQSVNASPLGLILGIGSGASYALYMVFSARLVRDIPPLPTAAYMLLGATLSMVSWTSLSQGIQLPTTPGAISAVAGLAIVATALPIGCLFTGLKRLDVLPAAILSTLEPVLAVLMAITLLGENLWLGQALGGICIISSALILQLSSSKCRKRR